DLVERYGADTLRMYEMFLGPVEQSKPWDTNGIEGVSRFIRKLRKLFVGEEDNLLVTDDAPEVAELKVLHKTLKKSEEDIERFSLNTCVSTFMICVNELGDLKCRKRAILEPLLIALCPFAPHIAEELWSKLGNTETISRATFPTWDEKYLIEDTVKYPVSFNGKMRFILEVAAGTAKEEVEKLALSAPDSQKWLEGKAPKKIIVVPGKIVNIVI
ncbi:MAG: class I tRNA ligase family protein, partial [Bacteroidales bacterium]|nr:class I tRNA ligase family protein [Bacteroidales bacterium]